MTIYLFFPVYFICLCFYVTHQCLFILSGRYLFSISSKAGLVLLNFTVLLCFGKSTSSSFLKDNIYGKVLLVGSFFQSPLGIYHPTLSRSASFLLKNPLIALRGFTCIRKMLSLIDFLNYFFVFYFDSFIKMFLGEGSFWIEIWG